VKQSKYHALSKHKLNSFNSDEKFHASKGFIMVSVHVILTTEAFSGIAKKEIAFFFGPCSYTSAATI